MPPSERVTDIINGHLKSLGEDFKFFPWNLKKNMFSIWVQVKTSKQKIFASHVFFDILFSVKLKEILNKFSAQHETDHRSLVAFAYNLEFVDLSDNAIAKFSFSPAYLCQQIFSAMKMTLKMDLILIIYNFSNS